jgi:hypothetical protein
MNRKITRSSIILYSIDLHEKHVYHYIHDPDTITNGKTPEGFPFEYIILSGLLKSIASRTNPTIPADAQEDTHRKNRNNRGDQNCLIDINEPENNAFIVMNQHPFIDNTQGKQ